MQCHVNSRTPQNDLTKDKSTNSTDTNLTVLKHHAHTHTRMHAKLMNFLSKIFAKSSKNGITKRALCNLLDDKNGPLINALLRRDSFVYSFQQQSRHISNLPIKVMCVSLCTAR